jgi:hypothetical protein
MNPIKAYRALRAFKSRPGELFPAMIQGEGVAKGAPPIRRGEEITAEYYPDKARSKGIAPRFGLHSGALPYAEQFDVKVRPEDLAYLGLPESAVGQRIIQPPDMVWTEVEIPPGRDMTGLVENMERVMGAPRKPWEVLKEGEENVAFMPRDAHYRYDPSNKAKRGDEPWIISDRATHTRLLSDEEVDEILAELGRPELREHKRRGGAWTEERLREAFPGWYAASVPPAALLTGAGVLTPADDVEAANMEKIRKHIEMPEQEREGSLIAGTTLGAPVGLEAYSTETEDAFPLIEQRLRDLGLLPSEMNP